MKYKFLLPALFVISVFISSCLPASNFDKNNCKEQIAAVLDSSATAWNNGDIEGYMSYYFKSDSLVFIGSKGKTFGWESTLNNYKKSYPDRESMGTLSFSDIDIMVLTETQVLVSGQWKLIRSVDEPLGRFTLYMVKLSPNWRIVYDHSSG